MDSVDAAPLMCAGVTVFNALRSTNDKANPPALVAVVGIGGLGKVAIQFASKFGCTVVAVSRGSHKKGHALEFGACGVCHSDSFSVEGTFGNSFPIAPGHEVIGKVVEAGADSSAQKFEEGTVVGIGWHGNHCQSCEACSDGDFICCDTKQITGIHFGGGYQQYMLAPAKTLARVPNGMDPITAAPLLCAGVTVFNALRGTNEKAKQPAIVAVVGVGGLGNLAIQYASKFGYTVVAISRGSDKKDHALELGATHYIDSKTENVGKSLQSLGGAKIVLSTAPSAAAAGACIDGLSRNGKLVVLGATKDQIPVTPLQLIGKRRTIVGWPAGTARDSQDAMEFAHFHKIGSKTVVFEGIDKAPQAYAAMRQGVYRVVIKVADE
eukprot:g11256.t1